METTEEMNKVIAEFMGITIRKDGKLALKDAEPLTGEYIVYAKFHTSWDYLMPVWAKLRPMLCERYMPTRLGRIHIRIENALLKPDITEAHKAIFEALTHLNSKQ